MHALPSVFAESKVSVLKQHMCPVGPRSYNAQMKQVYYVFMTFILSHLGVTNINSLECYQL